ncbi:MAG: 2-C-methyl-D-erythritol 2,4-cyclodiphosphate synthase [Coriobacteriaceae bacterium]|nr:2-C-methyl-D-erythritol 2,4-cyclodiphosphate synthase [Coriobacteriaceae bacterium]
MRIGSGIDVHAFASAEAGRPLLLAGVRINHPCGLEGHSDTDVLAHAVMDAILGASRLGDIGKLFPDTDERYRDADSLELLAEVYRLAKDSGVRLMDLDCVIMAQAPQLSQYREQMRENLARTLKITVEQVGIKSTTTEHLGFIGRQEGILAQAVVLMEECRC